MPNMSLMSKAEDVSAAKRHPSKHTANCRVLRVRGAWGPDSVESKVLPRAKIRSPAIVARLSQLVVMHPLFLKKSAQRTPAQESVSPIPASSVVGYRALGWRPMGVAVLSKSA